MMLKRRPSSGGFWRGRLRCLPARLITTVCLLVFFVADASVASACPMCKAGLASQHDRLVQAWGVSIVFLLSMPFVLVTSFSAYMYVLVRRARQEQSAGRAPSVRGVQSVHGDPIADAGPVSQAVEADLIAQRESVGV